MEALYSVSVTVSADFLRLGPCIVWLGRIHCDSQDFVVCFLLKTAESQHMSQNSVAAI